MRRYITAVMVAGALAAAVPGLAAAQDTARDGFWASFGLGYGSLAQEDFNGRQGGETVQLTVGGTVNDRLLVGASYSAWTRLENGIKVEAGLVAAMARFYPTETSGFFLSGGLGLGTIGEDVSHSGPGTETGFGGLVGVGYDLALGGAASLTPFVNWFLVGNTDANVNVAQFGLGVTVH